MLWETARTFGGKSTLVVSVRTMNQYISPFVTRLPKTIRKCSARIMQLTNLQASEFERLGIGFLGARGLELPQNDTRFSDGTQGILS